MEQMISPKHVETLKEASLMDVILAFYLQLMGLHAVVCAHVHSCMLLCWKEESLRQPVM